VLYVTQVAQSGVRAGCVREEDAETAMQDVDLAAARLKQIQEAGLERQSFDNV
jgi:hypothetical protein